MRITVVEAMNILPGTSTATVYRRLTSLRKKGLLEIQLDETDLRVKYVLPTKAATDYFSQLADCLVKASRR
jgi:hypothetical protein